MGERSKQPGLRERGSFAWVFGGAALRYWLIVFPRVARELRRLRGKAQGIPDTTLRGLALDALGKRGNIEGAAAFAAFVPSARRDATLRALVSFQAAYNYLDMLGEQPSAEPIANGRRLHEALLVALDPQAEHRDYYELCAWRDDGGYLSGMLDACREALAELPSYGAVSAAALDAGERIASFQSMHLSRLQGDHQALEAWARAQTPTGSGLLWWETAASGGSSLGVFALIALAAEPVVPIQDVIAVADAHFPAIGALHSLLDNLVDRSEDELAGQRSLVGYYASSEEAAARMGELARQSSAAARSLAGGPRYSIVLGGMASYYLSMPEADEPDVLPVSREIRAAIGGVMGPALAIFHLRSRLVGLRPGAPALKDKSASVGLRNGWGRTV